MRFFLLCLAFYPNANEGPYSLGQPTIGRREWADSGLPIPVWQSAEDDLPTGVSALESPDRELESADSNADSNADSAKVGVWVWGLKRKCNTDSSTYITLRFYILIW